MTGRPDPPGADLAIVDGTVYPSPDVPPIPRGAVLVRAGRIAAVGPDLSVPPGVPQLSAEGGAILAGFWNTHVHFTEPKWRDPLRQPAEQLDAALRDMFTQRGFTSVVDTGSDPRVTLPLRRRVESGDLLGPRILTSGPSIFPPRGIPYYLRTDLPFWIRLLVPQPSSPAAATRFVRRNLAGGADLVKLFTGSYVDRGRVRPMPARVAVAAVEAAHAERRLVFSHPSNLEGTRVAIDAGVDVLAHPPDRVDGVDEAVIDRMIERRMAMIPTLKMFADTVQPRPPGYLEAIYSVVERFRAKGGDLLFGTDVGYLRDYSTEDEFTALRRCGLGPTAILEMLTVGPARRFGLDRDLGTLEVGHAADVTVLARDPADDPLAFARIRASVRRGQILYGAGPAREPPPAGNAVARGAS